MKVILLAITFTLFFTNNCLGWEGTDVDTGESINIESRNEDEIEFTDENRGTHTGEIQDWGYNGYNNKLEVYDDDTGETRYFDMERE